MKTLLFSIFLLLSSCSYSEKGNFIIKYNNEEHKADSIQLFDEENKIKYKQNGKTYTFEGSFEVYQN